MENPKKHQEIRNSAFPKGIAGSCNRISPLSSFQLYKMSRPHLTWRVSDSWVRILCRNTHLTCLCTSGIMSPTKLPLLETWKILSSSKNPSSSAYIAFLPNSFSIQFILMTPLEHHLKLPQKRYLDESTFQATFHSHNRDGCILPAQSH